MRDLLQCREKPICLLAGELGQARFKCPETTRGWCWYFCSRIHYLHLLGCAGICSNVTLTSMNSWLRNKKLTVWTDGNTGGWRQVVLEQAQCGQAGNTSTEPASQSSIWCYRASTRDSFRASPALHTHPRSCGWRGVCFFTWISRFAGLSKLPSAVETRLRAVVWATISLCQVVSDYLLAARGAACPLCRLPFQAGVLSLSLAVGMGLVPEEISGIRPCWGDKQPGAREIKGQVTASLW